MIASSRLATRTPFTPNRAMKRANPGGLQKCADKFAWRQRRQIGEAIDAPRRRARDISLRQKLGKKGFVAELIRDVLRQNVRWKALPQLRRQSGNGGDSRIARRDQHGPLQRARCQVCREILATRSRSRCRQVLADTIVSAT